MSQNTRKGTKTSGADALIGNKASNVEPDFGGAS